MAAKNSQKPFLYFVTTVLEENMAIGLWGCQPFPPTTDTKYITISHICQDYGTLIEGDFGLGWAESGGAARES